MPPINLWNWSEVSVRCQWSFYQTCWVRKSSSAASTSFFASRSSFSFPAQRNGETVKRWNGWNNGVVFFGAQESTSQQQKSAKKNVFQNKIRKNRKTDSLTNKWNTQNNVWKNGGLLLLRPPTLHLNPGVNKPTYANCPTKKRKATRSNCKNLVHLED